MRPGALFVALFAACLGLGGCAAERAIALEIALPLDPVTGEPRLPPEVEQHELRILRLEEGEGCPPPEISLSALEDERAFVHGQQFEAAAGQGEAVGELPPGRYAISLLSRGEGCLLLLFGCTEARIGEGEEATLVVELQELEGELAGCGPCRSCEGALCSPDGAVCRSPTP